jgi:hypothetical protein
METKIITVHGKNFKTVSDKELGACTGCFAYGQSNMSCCDFTDQTGGNCNGVVFHELEDQPIVQQHQEQGVSFVPLGITSLRVHNTIRLNALMDVLQRYAQENTPAKPEWVQEVKSLIEYERSLTREVLDKVPFKL